MGWPTLGAAANFLGGSANFRGATLGEAANFFRGGGQLFWGVDRVGRPPPIKVGRPPPKKLADPPQKKLADPLKLAAPPKKQLSFISHLGQPSSLHCGKIDFQSLCTDAAILPSPPIIRFLLWAKFPPFLGCHFT